MKDFIDRKFFLCFQVSLIVLCLLTHEASASNYITVATIGNVPSVQAGQEPQKIVEQVIAFWKRELNQVLPDRPDLIVLPEFCDMSEAGDEYLRVRKNQVLDFFAAIAKTNSCYIVFGTRRQDDEGSWRNSSILIDRNGRIAGIYDKNFPTISEMESGTKAGNAAPVFKCDFGTVAMAICFDLNFDELQLKYAAQKPDIILFPSVYHGGLVQSEWAYACRSFFIGSVYREKPSEIRNPVGEVIATNTNYYDYAVARINLDRELVHLDYNRQKLAELKKKYGNKVDIHDPGKLGSVLITSNDEKISARQMVEEFKIERLDDYFARARNFRLKEGNMR